MKPLKVQHLLLFMSLAFLLLACGTEQPPETRHTLSVQIEGQGTVTSVPAGIGADSLSAEFASGTQVMLTATAAEGFAFNRWEGDCAGAEGNTCTLTMDGNKRATAVFTSTSTTVRFVLGSGDTTNWVDDALEFINGATNPANPLYEAKGTTWTRNTHNRLGYDVRHATPVLTGLRFREVTIPPGATIESAYIQFTARESHSDPISLTIHGQADADAGAFVDYAHISQTEGLNNVSNRTRTSASVAWNDIPAWTVGASGEEQRTPDLSDIVAEIVGLDGWVSGNSMVFIISGDENSTATRVAFAERLQESTPSSPNTRPTLVVTYR
jgi:hypothetical protein